MLQKGRTIRVDRAPNIFLRIPTCRLGGRITFGGVDPRLQSDSDWKLILHEFTVVKTFRFSGRRFSSSDLVWEISPEHLGPPRVGRNLQRNENRA